MDKTELTIFSIIVPIIYTLILWFYDYLTERIFVYAFGFIIMLILVVLFCFQIFLLYKNVKNVKKNKSYIIYTSILVLSLTLPFVISYRKAKVQIELSLYEKQRNEIIEMVKNNGFKYEYEGIIKLPIHKNTSSDGYIYVYQNDEEGTLVSFSVVRGMLSGSIELMYSSGKEELIKNNKTGHPITNIDELRDNWYYVETDY